jgi:GT2 family glycosyltransferase
MRLTWCINSYRNLPYLKLAIESIRKNAYYKGAPIIVYTENDSETGDWISAQPDITPIIEFNPKPKGIGGGANEAISRVQTEYFSLIHSDMYISRHYDRPLLDEVMKSETPTVACAWRFEPDIWHQPSRLGTTMVPDNTTEGVGVYWHDFDKENFEAFADEFVDTNKIRFRKVEGVSYIMRKKDWDRVGGNDPLYAPTSWEDNDLHVRMSALDYNFVVTSKAVVWHFGSRGANFMDQPDKITGRSDRQLKTEQINVQKFINKWGEVPTFDEYGFIVLTPTLKEKCQKLYPPSPIKT